jgi:hypothetical protein
MIMLMGWDYISELRPPVCLNINHEQQILKQNLYIHITYVFRINEHFFFLFSFAGGTVFKYGDGIRYKVTSDI